MVLFRGLEEEDRLFVYPPTWREGEVVTCGCGWLTGTQA